VRQVRQFEFAIGWDQNRRGREDEQIFQKPIAAIARTNRECDPENHVDRNRELQETIVDEARCRSTHCVFLRLVSVTTNIITMAPSMAESMSFCASHSSPWPPSQFTPCPGATISATIAS